MKNRIELAGSICRIAENGDLSFAPNSRNLIYLLLTVAGLLGVWLWVRVLGTIAATLLLVSTVVVLIRWANQPKVQITPASGMIEWRRWFRRRQCSFVEVSRVDVFLDQQMYDLLGHWAVRKRTVEQHARLELILKDGSHLSLGRISGEHVHDRALSLAESVARVIRVPVSNTGNASKF